MTIFEYKPTIQNMLFQVFIKNLMIAGKVSHMTYLFPEFILIFIFPAHLYHLNR